MNMLLSHPSFLQSHLLMEQENTTEFDNNNMTFTSLDENNSTQSQNYIQLNQSKNNNNNYFCAPFNANAAKQMITNITSNTYNGNKSCNSRDRLTNLKPCSIIHNSTSYQASEFYYAFNILPINLNYLSGKKNFSFLSDLNRGVDVCEMSFDTQTVHIFYQDITILPQTYEQLNCLSLTEEKYIPITQKLQQSAQLTFSLNNQISYSEAQQNSFNERSKKAVNSYFTTKKEKRMFALSSSFNPSTQRQSFSVHFSPEMIHTLGYETDSFMLKCSITGFNEFMMRNDFFTNMESVIEGFTNQILTSSESDPIKIKQKFSKNQDEAMEAVFAVYMLKDASLQSSAESVIVFEILHILDFQVSTKGKKYVSKKRQFDLNESVFLDRYLKSLNQTQISGDFHLDETSGESGLESAVKKNKKGIQKAAKNTDKSSQKRKSRKAKDFISY